jgi:hypothetical protein
MKFLGMKFFKATALAVGLASTLAFVGCGKDFNRGFCTEFKKSFLKSCTDVCTQKSGKATECASRCEEALPEDATYKKRCLTNPP